MTKAKDKRTISFSITGEEKVPATEMVSAIKHIQNIIYHIGDYLNGTPNRPKGDFPQVVKEHCTLFITNLKMGSVIADMQIGDAQTGLPSVSKNLRSVMAHHCRYLSPKLRRLPAR